MEENNVLWLSVHGTGSAEEKDYIFSTDDPDSTDREPFNPVAADLMAELAEGYFPLIQMGYDVKRPSKKRRFRKNIPAVFSESCEAAKWEFLLRKTDWQDGFYTVQELAYILNGEIFDAQALRIMPNKLEPKLLEKMLEDPFYNSRLTIYGVSAIPEEQSKFTEADFQRCIQSLDYSLYISPNQDRTWLNITIKLSEYPEEKLIERTKRVAERHGKVLEVYT